MPYYHHKYQCNKCGIFTIRTDSAVPPYNNSSKAQHTYFRNFNVVKMHEQIYNAHFPKRIPMEDCTRYVKYISSVTRGNTPANTKVTAINKARTLANYMSRGNDTPSMVAVMYDTLLEDWFQGSTGQGRERGKIPITIWRDIPENNDVSLYSFGRGCAEVDCLRHAFLKRSQKGILSISIEGCIFAARKPSRGNGSSLKWPACTACSRWIKKNKAETV